MPNVIFWFRQDLRLVDNPGFTAAMHSGHSVIPVYILDDDAADPFKMGAASRVWLHHSLEALDKSLNGKLVMLNGNAEKLLPQLIRKTKADKIFWNRCYEPWRVKQDDTLSKLLDVECETFNGSLLWEPWDVVKKDGTPYKVFSPFYKRGCLGKDEPREPMKKPSLKLADYDGGVALTDMKLLPRKPEPRWDLAMNFYTQPGEDGAQKALRKFLDYRFKDYRNGRDFLKGDHGSHISPHLHFGEVSPNQMWHAAKHYGEANHLTTDLAHFHSELGWREFNYHLLYHFPMIPTKNFQPKFDKFPWRKNAKELQSWQKGMTGYPVVDAAMRELWQTGYMHNRARMIVGSFLVKHLLLDWREGERWFWDCLFDADLANNAGNWQWIAGSGADAAPYFRIFNPVLQGEKFDKDGTYIRRFVPELASMPNKYLHKPWQAPSDVLAKTKIVLGKDYPKPIVDHEAARVRALQALAKTRNA